MPYSRKVRVRENRLHEVGAQAALSEFGGDNEVKDEGLVDSVGQDPCESDEITFWRRVSKNQRRIHDHEFHVSADGTSKTVG